MKFGTTILLILLGVLLGVPTVQAQNCCAMHVGAPQITGSTVTVMKDDVVIGTYISPMVSTTPIACVNTSNKDAACQTGVTTPSNVVTALGYGAYSTVRGEFVACSPSFTGTPTTQPATPPAGGATYTVVGKSYQQTFDANGNCLPALSQPFAISSCNPAVCITQTGGGCPLCPNSKVCEAANGCPNSPVILDLTGNGFVLTSAASGVKFDMTGTGAPEQIAWTAPGVDNAFLALPGADGLVHNGQQLFGNYTPQPTSDSPNGFAALAVYDDPKNGGNGDGVIDSRDAIFSALRLWIDENHDGISQPNELHTLPSLGVNSISLRYKEDDKTDQYGNKFRYRAMVNPDHPDQVGRTAYDVFFVGVPTSTSAAVVHTCLVPKVKALPDTTKSGFSRR